MSLYADILLPLAQPTYTFAVKEGMELNEGMAVAVPFGYRSDKLLTGIVWRLHNTPPAAKRIRTVERLLYGGVRLLSPQQMQLWEWIAEYYLSSLGEVMRLALPSLLKPSALTGECFVEPAPHTERYLSIAADLHDPERLKVLLDRLEKRAPRQYSALMQLANLCKEYGCKEIPRRLIASDMAPLRALEKQGRITLRSASIVEEGPLLRGQFQLPILSPAQQQALEEILKGWERVDTALLYGITGSGKTEIYIHLIAKQLAQGRDVLLLVPEIALTTQLIERLEEIFSSRVTPYHSKLSEARRMEIFLRLAQNRGGNLVVGARSALFLPFQCLGLIIVDEEHDSGYKQRDFAPRYQARDCAVAAARILGCKTLLGSATPSLESWINALSERYALARLSERYGEARPPKILLSDTLRAVKRGERKSHFNLLLINKLKEVLERSEQAILFQNRRGYAPYVSCTSCGHTPRCPRCNVSLSYHRQQERLVCHYCGHSEPMPTACPRCQGALQGFGFGTEKVVEELQRLLPEARILRLDRDAVHSERGFRTLISAFERGEADILVGTQMVSKGLDFDRVSLVGILNADNLLLSPDFRAAERAYQLMTQVSGRSGRSTCAGEVVIQSADPSHPIIRRVVENDYEAMALDELREREAFGYPPYTRLIHFSLGHRDEKLVQEAALHLSNLLRDRFGKRVLGPAAPLIDRIREEYRVEILLKIERKASTIRARRVVREVVKTYQQTCSYKGVNLRIDVDPQ